MQDAATARGIIALLTISRSCQIDEHLLVWIWVIFWDCTFLSFQGRQALKHSRIVMPSLCHQIPCPCLGRLHPDSHALLVTKTSVAQERLIIKLPVSAKWMNDHLRSENSVAYLVCIKIFTNVVTAQAKHWMPSVTERGSDTIEIGFKGRMLKPPVPLSNSERPVPICEKS